MKRITFSLSSLLVLSTLLTMTSCNKEEAADGTQFRATMENCTSQNGKTTLSGTALNWQSGDRIAIYGTAGCGVYSAIPQTPATYAIFDKISGTTGGPTFQAFYPTTLTTNGVNITLPVTQTYVENSIHEFPMYAESSSNALEFKNLCGVLKLHLTKSDVSISTISITASSEINGTFNISHSEGNLELNHVSGGSSTTTLTCATAQSIANGKFFYIYLPAGNYSGLQIEVNSDDGRYCIKTANTSISVVRSRYTLITFGENDLDFVEPLPQGSLPGLFSVSATQQVRFSQGNLQYQASTQTWRFAEHQYDFVGADNANISNTYTGWIDLFGWGTGSNPTLASTSNADYSTFVDWGVNSISNGGDIPNTWRTLTLAEMQYLTGSASPRVNKMGTGTINGIHGLILLPDSWSLPEGLLFTASTYDWPNTYTLTQWKKMETAGAVFFPAGGYRNGTAITGIGTYADYWTSSSTWGGGAGRMAIQRYSISCSNPSFGRYAGGSVRLVYNND